MTEKKIIKKSSGSKKYRANLDKIKTAAGDSQVFELEKAVELLMDLEQPNFKEGVSVEVHFKLDINTTKSNQLVRSSVSLPHGTGKEIKIAAFVSPENVEKAQKAGASLVGGGDLIDEIKKTGKINFDIAIAEPVMMRKLGPVARILGTSGVMPSPKTQTVGTNIEEMIKTIKAGKVDYKNDKTGNLHIIAGKISKKFTKEQLIENIQAVLESVKKAKPEAIKKKYIVSTYVTSVMSPSIRIA